MANRTLGRVCAIAGFMIAAPAAQDPGSRGAPPQGAGGGGGGGRQGRGPQAQGTLTPMAPDDRGWGWQVKAGVSPNTPRPFYNKAKELLFQDKQVTSYTISSFNTDLYCEVGKHFDYIWFEMQHSTMSSMRCGA